MAIRNLSGRKCLVTGAASGIGRATALAAAREGALLFLTDINGPGLARVAAEIEAAGGIVALSRALNIEDIAAVRTFADDIHRKSGPLDIVMNIAGISIWGEVENLTHEHWRQVVEINLMGPIHVIECFIPAMIAGGRGGHLVNVSSAAGLFGLPWHAAYSAAKFGLRGISEVLRFDLARHGIGVSLVCPGAVRTGLVETIKVLGVDVRSPAVQAFRAGFEHRAVTPEAAAAAILKGIRRNRYLVFTSADIRIGHWLQCRLPFLYRLLMRRLNDRMQAVAAASRRGAAS
ncbi:SDR family oxidoreductase [Zavarzinia compransoris]|uniref:Short chain dehydrogenase n=1 Tax=Zavarzinia compransoris TaxID=1264899 RepID=A0A317E3Y5_9PROT|nr:SDR family oxidoreductase [Zavarzinia compransoris]PWR21747.1 short chain dehydrogenase [Zavarzinia compransoris]TDP45463.1 short-subunit dehydrogenase [Zavarzinia compransoris]